MATVNPWSRFRALLPSQVRYRAEVISVDTVRGTSYIELSSGQRITVTGTSAAAGAQVMIVDGVIAATLPSLPFSRIEVDV
jgi:hypothetical protein